MGTCLIASSNYVINEFLDAQFDKFHPTKKHRSVVSEDVKPAVVWTMWIVLAIIVSDENQVGIDFVKSLDGLLIAVSGIIFCRMWTKYNP